MRTDGRTDRWTDRHEKLLVAFRNFAKAPKNEIVIAFVFWFNDKIRKSVSCSRPIVNSVLTCVSLT